MAGVVHIDGANIYYIADRATGEILGWLNAANQPQLLADIVGSGGSTNTVIDGGEAFSNYGGSTPINGGTA